MPTSLQRIMPSPAVSPAGKRSLYTRTLPPLPSFLIFVGSPHAATISSADRPSQREGSAAPAVPRQIRAHAEEISAILMASAPRTTRIILSRPSLPSGNLSGAGSVAPHAPETTSRRSCRWLKTTKAAPTVPFS